MLRRIFVPLLAASALVAGCANTDGSDPSTGSVTAALGFDGPIHDVVAMEVIVVAAPGTCADEPVAAATVPLEAEFLPVHLEPDPPGGDMHPFGDAFFVLAPGDYHVCATPLTADGVPTEHCGSVEADATVVAEQTTEILLLSQCLGDPSGALDVIVALNDPPQIDDLTIEGSKFIDLCTFADINVFASDPNGDALNWTWSVSGTPDGGTGTLTGVDSQMDFTADTPGAYEITVVVDDGHGASASMSFPIHVSFAECGCDVDDVELNCAEEAVYVHDGEALYSFDPIAIATTLIGPFADSGGLGVSEVFDIAIDPDGRLYGVTGGGTLYLIDPVTAVVTAVGGGSFQNGLTFLGDGTLVATGGDTVSTIDPATGVQTAVISGTGFNSSGDIVATPGGELLWTVGGGDQLVSVDLGAGTTTLLGNIGVAAVYGLAWADGQLWGFTANGEALVLDPGTGGVISVNPLPPTGWLGATSNTSLF